MVLTAHFRKTSTYSGGTLRPVLSRYGRVGMDTLLFGDVRERVLAVPGSVFVPGFLPPRWLILLTSAQLCSRQMLRGQILPRSAITNSMAQRSPMPILS